MLSNTTVEELEKLITRDHPQWVQQAVREKALQYRAEMDARLEPLLRGYLETGVEKNLRVGEFSVIQIQRLRPGRSYFEALILMDAYLKNADDGWVLIMRR